MVLLEQTKLVTQTICMLSGTPTCAAGTILLREELDPHTHQLTAV
jgi:hypothetical protein